MPTHKDWEDARNKRDSNARLAARALLQGRTARALEFANRYDAWELTMSRIAQAMESEREG